MKDLSRPRNVSCSSARRRRWRQQPADELQALLDPSRFRYLAIDPAEQTEEAVRGFEARTTAAVLVADTSAEEGRNFQFADVLVHVGPPASANRLEQRIGRCDRWAAEGSTSCART